MALIKVGTSDANSVFIPFGGGVTIPIDGLAAPPAVAPVANFTASSTSVVENETVLFYDTSTNNPTGWSWTFTTTNTVNYVNATSSTSQNPQVQFVGTDSVDVQLQATNSAGSDTETKLDYISVSAGGVAPTASFTFSNTNPSTGDTVTFNNTTSGGATGYSWTITGGTYTLQNGTTLTDTSPQVTFTQVATYGVTLEATNQYGSDTAFNQITSVATGSAPVASFTISDSTPDTGQTVTFTDTSTNGPTGWTWTITGGTFSYVNATSSTSQNPQVQFDEDSTTYTIQLEAENSFGSSTAQQDITTNAAATPAPVASFTISDSTPDTGQTVTFTDTSTNSPTGWSWSVSGGTYAFVGGTSSSSQNPQISFSAASTNYTVNLTATNAGGSDSTSFTNNITTNGTASLPTGVTMHYDFSDASCYSGGSSITDLGSAGADGTIVGSGYAHTSGSTGYMSVTGGSAYVSIATNSTLESELVNDFTYYYIVKDVTDFGGILHNGNPTAFNDPSSTPELYVYALARNNVPASNSSLDVSNQPDTTTAWRHLAVTKSGGTFKWYVDGTLTETDTVTSFNYTTYSQAWLMWRRPRDYTSSLFSGKHAVFMAYGSVLTDSEIGDIYTVYSADYS